MKDKFDFFIFGSTSEIMQHLISTNKQWFKDNVNHLYVSQRGPTCPEVYKDFEHTVIQLDCADPGVFRAGLTDLVKRHVTGARPVHVFSTYGKFTWDYAEKSPVFRFSDDGLQVNLNSRLQIIDAFKEHGSRVKFHVMGSLFANFPYTGDYGLSMWYVNQIPRNAEYSGLHVNVYNIGGCKTRFWKHESMPNNPFLHDEIPSGEIFKAGFLGDKRGVFTFYPSAMSRFACFLGSRGVRVL
ncbi:MAG: hypothetical protein R3B70_03965 [Polyangiaceae bacterium]